MIQWVSEANRLRAELPPEVQATLLQHEAAGTYDDPAYQQAMTEFYNRHVCRVVPNPDCVVRTMQNIAQWPEVYYAMNGPSEFHVIGTLKQWDITARLGEIRFPTLVIGGRFDEATPAITETVHRGIPNSEWVIFENSSHMPHLEESDRYMHVLDDFLTRVESKA
jgi:L-proline amide hydrolase